MAPKYLLRLNLEKDFEIISNVNSLYLFKFGYETSLSPYILSASCTQSLIKLSGSFIISALAFSKP